MYTRGYAEVKIISYECAIADCAFDDDVADWATGSNEPVPTLSTCEAGKEYYTDGECHPICGDGILTGDEVCDYTFPSGFSFYANVFACDEFCEAYLPSF